MKQVPTNIHVDNHNGKSASAGWELGGALYHLWFELKTMEIEHGARKNAPTIYKNPLVKRGEEGFFETRHLDASKKENAEVVRAVFQKIEEMNLIEGARIKTAAREAAQRAEDKESARQLRIEKAAPRLFEALQQIKTHFLDGYSAVLPKQVAVIKEVRTLLSELGEKA